MQLDICILSVCVIVLAWRQAKQARALRVQTVVISDLIHTLAFVTWQLNATPAERVAKEQESLEKLRLLLKTVHASRTTQKH